MKGEDLNIYKLLKFMTANLEPGIKYHDWTEEDYLYLKSKGYLDKLDNGTLQYLNSKLKLRHRNKQLKDLLD